MPPRDRAVILPAVQH